MQIIQKRNTILSKKSLKEFIKVFIIIIVNNCKTLMIFNNKSQIKIQKDKLTNL